VALFKGITPRDIPRQHARIGRLDVAADERDARPGHRPHAKALQHADMGMAAADENEILSDRNALLHRLHYARAARVDRLRHPRGRPAGLPERPFSNGLPRCFCCFCRKLSADINFCSAEILELGPRGRQRTAGLVLFACYLPIGCASFCCDKSIYSVICKAQLCYRQWVANPVSIVQSRHWLGCAYRSSWTRAEHSGGAGDLQQPLERPVEF
jgi:hypothetical protein